MFGNVHHLLFGPAGCGKTYAAEMRAKEQDAALIAYQCHEWSDADELIVGVDVTSAVAGDADNVRQPGVLLQAAEKSLHGKVVLLIDELDKAAERTEYLLLDFLQSGRVPYKPGHHVQACMENLECWITSNEIRDHSDALLRRCRRHWMKPLPVQKQVLIIQDLLLSRHDLKLPTKAVEAAWKAALWIAKKEGNDSLSPQEGRYLIAEICHQCKDYSDMLDAYQSWACRTRDGIEHVHKCKALPHIWSALGVKYRPSNMLKSMKGGHDV